MTTLLEVKAIHKTHDREATLRGVSLQVEKGEILCLLGPSGCGKTTLLRIIAGLEMQDQGSVVFEGKDLSGMPPHHRQFSMMFQEFALFPHKNVVENIAFGLKIKKLDAGKIERRSREVLSLVGLEGMENRNVAELSGGERQRVALARSLAPQPHLLMLDEPMGSLDRALRERLIRDLRHILKRVGVTVIFVTHDQNEAYAVADRIAVFNIGIIEQLDRPEIVYKTPKNAFVARFLGFQNLLPGIATEKGLIQTEIGTLSIAEQPQAEGEKVVVLIRPEAARLVEGSNATAEDETLLAGQVTDRRFQGANYQLTVSTQSRTQLVFNLPVDAAPPAPDQNVQLALINSAMAVIQE